MFQWLPRLHWIRWLWQLRLTNLRLHIPDAHELLQLAKSAYRLSPAAGKHSTARPRPMTDLSGTSKSPPKAGLQRRIASRARGCERPPGYPSHIFVHSALQTNERPCDARVSSDGPKSRGSLETLLRQWGAQGNPPLLSCRLVLKSAFAPLPPRP